MTDDETDIDFSVPVRCTEAFPAANISELSPRTPRAYLTHYESRALLTTEHGLTQPTSIFVGQRRAAKGAAVIVSRK